jgi:hypothetical protein
MDSYFVRMTKFSVPDSFVDGLWKQHQIAIHYPFFDKDWEPSQIPNKADETSLDSGRYKSSRVGTSIKNFRELGVNGGYVWAEYRDTETDAQKDRIRVGVVRRGSLSPDDPSTYIQSTRWQLGPNESFRDGSKEKEAKIKCLQLVDSKPVGRGEFMSFRAARPPYVTISKWQAVMTKSNINRLQYLVEGKPLPREWESLFTHQQEAACAEYMRDPESGFEGSKLKHLLMPVGRTLKDVDIVGYAIDGNQLFAQVTFEGQSTEKLQALINCKAAGQDPVMVYFGKGELDDSGVQDFDGQSYLFIPWKRVEEWVKRDPDYMMRILNG